MSPPPEVVMIFLVYFAVTIGASLGLAKVIHLRGTTLGRLAYVIMTALTGGITMVLFEVLMSGIPAPIKEDTKNMIWFFTFFSEGAGLGFLGGILTCPFMRGR